MEYRRVHRVRSERRCPGGAAIDGFENPDRPEQALAVVGQANGEFASTRDSQFGTVECHRIDIDQAHKTCRPTRRAISALYQVLPQESLQMPTGECVLR